MYPQLFRFFRSNRHYFLPVVTAALGALSIRYSRFLDPKSPRKDGFDRVVRPFFLPLLCPIGSGARREELDEAIQLSVLGLFNSQAVFQAPPENFGYKKWDIGKN